MANLFDAFDTDTGAQPPAETPAQPAAPPVAASKNMFDQFDDDLKPENQTSATGGLLHAAERTVIPAATGMAAFGAGAAIGGGIGAGAGLVGALPGAILGGAAMWGASYLTAKVQDWGLHSLPESWQEALGQDDRQQQLDQEYHPTASFIGGMLPYMLTMRPNLSAATKALPENPTMWDKILANPATARVFGGVTMGGLEVGQELIAGQKPDWRNVAIATGFGMVFNAPTKLGEALTEQGARRAQPLGEAIARAGRAARGVPEPVAAPEPTVAQAADAKVMGPGITEDVFMGSHEQAPEAAMTAQDTARTEKSLLGSPPEAPDVGAVARRMEPELFAKYDALSTQISDLRAHMENLKRPSDENVQTAQETTAALQAQLDQHVAARGGYTAGPEARALRAQIRFAQSQHDEMIARRDSFAAGQGAYTPEMTALQQHIIATDRALMDLAPEVGAAHRRADDAVGAGTVPPEVVAPVTQPAAAAPQTAPEAPGTPVPVAAQEQGAAIAADVARQFIAAGRPADEAAALGQVEAARYVRRAARLNGAVGTPQDLYNVEGAQIRAAGQPAAASVATKGRRAPKSAVEIDPALAKAEADRAGVSPLVTQLLPSASDKEISNVIGGKLSEAQVAAFRKGVGAAAPVTEMAQQTAPISTEGTSFIITQAQRQSLGDMGYSPDAIRNMTPAAAHEVLRSGAAPEGEMTRQALADYLRNGGTISGAGRDLFQGKQGSIRIVEGQKSVIKLFRDSADPSTPIHELGHEWLEDLFHDANHPAATDQLRADAQIAAKWMGLEKPADLYEKTPAGKQTKRAIAAHEKFARGAETYMREGVAPSTALARVFAQFKSWISAVYEKLRDNGQPINDDIRGVFDRMLAEEPNRTVIAPERPSQPSLASIHETDAAEAHPAEASAVGDRIVSERDRYVTEQPPEIQNEIARADAERAELGREAGTGEGGQREVGGGGGEPEADAPGGGGGGERGPVVAGGNAGVAEGAGLPAGGQPAGGPTADTGLRGERPGAAGSVGAQPLAPRPAAIFGTSESPYVDKAGNIKRTTLGSVDDVWSAVKASAARNKDFIGDRQGVVTDGQVLDLAQRIGMDGAAHIVDQWVRGKALNAPELVALGALVDQSGADVHASWVKSAATGTPEDILAQSELEARHDLIQAALSGAIAESARATRAIRLIKERTGNLPEIIKQATGKTLFQKLAAAKLGAVMETPAQVAKHIRDMQTRSAGRMLVQLVVNDLISNPITHMTYAAGNALLLAKKMVIDTPGAALIGEARARLGYEGDRVRLGEVPAGLSALWRGMPAAIKAVGQAVQTGVQARLPGDTDRYALPFQQGAETAPHPAVDMTTTWHSLVSEGYGVVSGIPNAIMAYGDILKAGGIDGAPLIGLRYSHLGPIPDVEFKGVNVLPVGTVLGGPGRMVAAIHSLFNVLNYSVDIAQRSYRQAAAEGHVGNALAERTAWLTANPSEEMMAKSVSLSKDMTLMGKSGDFMSRVSNLTNWEINLPGLGNTQPLKFIDPFVKIAGQMSKQAVGTQTPLGLISLVAPEKSELGSDLRGRNGIPAQDMAVAKMVTGTAVALGFMALKAQQLMTGAGPSDPRQAANWRMLGNQPYSIRIGDIFYPLHRLGPLGFLAGLGADIYDSAASASRGDMQKAAGQFLFSFSQNFLSEGFMRGPADMMKAIQNPQRDGERYISNFLGMFVPYSQGMAQWARSLDPYQRQSRNVVDAIKAKLPWVSQTLQPRRDIFGEPITNLPTLWPTSIYESRVNNDPVLLAMQNLSIFPGQVNRKIRNVELNDQQYDDYARLAGRMLKSRLDVIVRSPDWQTFNPQAQHDTITAQITLSRESARNVVMAKYPEILRQATVNKRAPLKKPPQGGLQ